MSRTDIHHLRDTGLDAFLQAPVGTEINGSTLTMLSVLARLGHDPWAEAARWARLPPAAVIDRLADSIAQMPLSPESLAEARGTALRLSRLLPGRTTMHPQAPISALPVIALATVISVALALAFVMNTVPRHAAKPASVAHAGHVE